MARRKTMNVEDLNIWRFRYKAELIREKRKERIKNGDGSGSLIKVRF